METGKFRYTIVYNSLDTEDYRLIRKGGGKPNRAQVKNHKEFIENGGFAYVDSYESNNPEIKINSENMPVVNTEYISFMKQNKWTEIREIRDQLLAETDFTQLPDAPFSDESREAFKEYRQLLRDITLQTNPFEINWPERPQ